VFSRGSASPQIDQNTGRWLVTVDLRDDGQAVWNTLASSCFSGSPECPSRQLAIVLDDVVQSAPTVNQPAFSTGVEITGAFSEEEVRSLARVLNRGAFPVDVEAQRVETVSPTAGSDSLRAAIIAGIIGVSVMLLGLVLYYRRIAIIVVAGLMVWGATVFSLAAFVSQATNYALSLAGVTGIIVAIGVTIDSYIVLFERLKDEVRSGRTPRNAAPRSFQSTWRTILAADLVSVMASAILFWLSVGSVKGFALYLGLTTLADLVVCYLFTRPAVILLASKYRDGRLIGLGATS
jgi:preprotein translocase subunit SecD